MRTLLGLLAHWASSAFVAAAALQWLSVSNGRAQIVSLVVPSAFGGTRSWQGPLVLVAGACGAVLAPFLWRVLRRAPWPRATSAFIGVLYTYATLVLTVAVCLPIVSVVGRAPGRAPTSALAEGTALAVVGTPLIAVAAGLVMAPPLILGGAVVGLLTQAAVRRGPSAHASSPGQRFQ